MHVYCMILTVKNEWCPHTQTETHTYAYIYECDWSFFVTEIHKKRIMPQNHPVHHMNYGVIRFKVQQDHYRHILSSSVRLKVKVSNKGTDKQAALKRSDE